MSVTMIPPSLSANHSRCATGCVRPSAQCIERKSRELVIGLVNNMSDGALESTEHQFVSLLNAASDEFSVNLSLYALPGISRSASAQSHIDRHYNSVESLLDMELDALIVTGREPIAANLSDEPYWHSFVNLLEWARKKTYSTIWSCLAAHAAVLHMDGIERVRSGQKHSGIIDSTRAAEHPITENLPARFRLPHSRWNGLPEADLIRTGYQVMIQAVGAGADCFVKQEQSLFLFFQSHPEYELETLLLEYRRDVLRFLRGETSRYPNIPQGYFGHQTVHELSEVQREAAMRPYEETLARIRALLTTDGVEDSWSETATTLYRNWLQYISSAKRGCMQKKHVELGMRQNTLPQVLLDPAELVSR